MPSSQSSSFCNPFAADGFFPRWQCGDWTDFHGWTHIVADVAIFGAYAAIPALILYFVLKRKDVQLPSLWWLFAAFIFSCGFGHLIEAVIFWHPWYRFSGAVKVVTAIVSWGTVIALARHMPALLNLPRMHQLNQKLRDEIAARAKTEAERERFFNLSLDMLCVADMSGRFTRANPAFFDVLGYTEAEMTSRPFLEFVHPDDRAATQREMDLLSAGQSSFALENRYRSKDGSWRWLAWKATPSPEDGLIYAIAHDITDVHARRAAEAEQAGKALRLQDALLQLRDDIGGDLGEFHRKALRACAEALSVESVTLWQFDADRGGILCVEQHDASGRRASVGMRLAALDYPAYFAAIARDDSVIVADDARGHPDTREFFKDGATLGDVSSMLDAPVRGGDELYGLLCCEHAGPARRWTGDEVRFVTSLAGYVQLAIQQDKRLRTEEEIRRLNATLEQRVAKRTAEVAESEHRFRLMVEQVQDYAIYMLDCDGRVASWNVGAQRAKGYVAAEILGRHFSCFYDAGDVASGKPAAILARAREHGRVLDEGWRVRKDGSRFWAEVVVTAIHDDNGELRGFAKVTHDLTERKKIEAQSLRSQRLESIGTLAGGIAHDLNNALAPILMAIGVLRTDMPGSSGILDIIQSSANRGADMVRQLLSFAKGVEGRRAPVALGELVQEVVAIVRSTFPKNIRIVTRVADDLPAIIGDSTQLHQVLLNLCVNSRDAMADGGLLTIEVETVDVDNAFLGTLDAGGGRLGRHVRLRVIDTGSGIPPEVVDRIFDPFFTTKAPDKGSGLGLSNALGIIKGHGGFFHVYSQVARGTTLSIYLPIAAGSAVPVETPAAPVGELRGRGERILFVDDEAPVRAVARRVLETLGYSPITAHDGTDALIQVAQSGNLIRAVVTDLHMPHMDGEAFARALRRMAPDIPIIVASGRVDDVMADKLRSIGVKTLLPKPFTQEQLARALSDTLSKST